MVCRGLALATLLTVTAAFPFPFPIPSEGFRPVHGARGPGQSPSRYNPNYAANLAPRVARGSEVHNNANSFTGALAASFKEGGFGGSGKSGGGHVASATRQSISFSQGGGGHRGGHSSGGHGLGGGGGHGGGQGGRHGGGSLGEPDKTIYVKLPQGGNQFTASRPQSAGPPQKHYRIVIIRSPNPAPVQQVLPPRTEQKTIIYVLHQKARPIQPQVLEAPVVKHPPQVLFVGYDDELSSADLQQLAKGDHTGFSVSAQQEPVIGGDGGGDFGGHQVSGGGYSGGGGGFGDIRGLEPLHSSGSSFSRGGALYNKKRRSLPPGRVSTSSSS